MSTIFYIYIKFLSRTFFLFNSYYVVMRIHFIGIKGISMEFLARLCERFGMEVSGSDIKSGGHKASNVHGADAVVYSYAIGENNPEFAEAKRLGIPMLSRAELLGKLSHKYDKVIAISGTHGKTTTTGMFMSAMCDLDPTVHIGGTIKGKLGNIGSRKLFITEACEYCESFLSLCPDVGVVLNVELDHADYYKTYANFYDAFEKFAGRCKVAFVCGDNEAKTLRGSEKTFTFGTGENCDYCARITGNAGGYYSFTPYFRGERLDDVTLNVRGAHNVTNAMAVVAYCHFAGLPYGGISDFSGVDRRNETLCVHGGVEYISDYAHHPHEIQCTLEMLKQVYKRVLTVFEPHTYSRTQAFYKEFAAALSLSDEVLLLPVYAARETPIAGVDRLIAKEGGFKLSESYDSAAETIDKIAKDFDAVVFMGAGSVDDFGRMYIKKFRK